jgi:lipoyl(octanoyl) transferase
LTHPYATGWQILVTPPAPGPFNMALDEALMDHAASTGCWIFRVYGWSVPTVSFGRHQAAARTYDQERIRAAGCDAVRRPTGGRAILHHREVTYSVAAPLTAAGDLNESYAGINRLLVEGLRTLGVAAEVAAPTSRAAAPSAHPCFDHPSAGELIVAGRKLVGSAQWRSHHALLQHGSILIDNDQTALASLLSRDREQASDSPASGLSAVATLSDLLGSAPSFETVAGALTSAVRNRDPGAVPLTLTPALIGAANDLERRYSDDAWTWRR